jgi:hypothetical protein
MIYLTMIRLVLKRLDCISHTGGKLSETGLNRFDKSFLNSL